MFFEYRDPPAEGFWGAPTSTIDWCEENYVVSFYIAEAINTLTNAAFIALAVYALSKAISNNFEKRFVFSCFGFMLVGVGSWLFHMTLKYHFQLLDELPMIYATCIPCWSVFSFGRSKSASKTIGTSIFVGAATLTAIYLRLKNPTIHQAAYGVLNVAIIFESVRQAHTYVRDPVALSNLNWTLAIGVFEFLFGWFLWNLDIHLCSMWRSWRRALGMPLGFLLEGHGWWHLFTGLGVYSYLLYLEYLRLFQTGRQGDFEWIWRYRVVPTIEPRRNKHL